MKKIILPLLFIIAFSCKNENSQEIQTLSGEFLYVADGAVLQTKSEVYAVAINELTEELANESRTFQTDEFDMTSVTVKGIITPNNEEGWKNLLKITEIISVKKSDTKNTSIID